MFTDTVGLQFKAFVFAATIQHPMFSHLPSQREARIQAEKLQRMAKAFQRKFPAEMVLSVPKNKLDKMRGVERHRVNQQCKVVDRLLMKLMEEMTVESWDLNFPSGPKITKKKIRSSVQKFVHKFNKQVHEAHQKALQETFSSWERALSGIKS
jgi:hypothetical protein